MREVMCNELVASIVANGVERTRNARQALASQGAYDAAACRRSAALFDREARWWGVLLRHSHRCVPPVYRSAVLAAQFRAQSFADWWLENASARERTA